VGRRISADGVDCEEIERPGAVRLAEDQPDSVEGGTRTGRRGIQTAPIGRKGRGQPERKGGNREGEKKGSKPAEHYWLPLGGKEEVSRGKEGNLHNRKGGGGFLVFCGTILQTPRRVTLKGFSQVGGRSFVGKKREESGPRALGKVMDKKKRKSSGEEGVWGKKDSLRPGSGGSSEKKKKKDWRARGGLAKKGRKIQPTKTKGGKSNHRKQTPCEKGWRAKTVRSIVPRGVKKRRKCGHSTVPLGPGAEKGINSHPGGEKRCRGSGTKEKPENRPRISGGKPRGGNKSGKPEKTTLLRGGGGDKKPRCRDILFAPDWSINRETYGKRPEKGSGVRGYGKNPAEPYLGELLRKERMQKKRGSNSTIVRGPQDVFIRGVWSNIRKKKKRSLKEGKKKGRTLKSPNLGPLTDQGWAASEHGSTENRSKSSLRRRKEKRGGVSRNSWGRGREKNQKLWEDPGRKNVDL